MLKKRKRMMNALHNAQEHIEWTLERLQLYDVDPDIIEECLGAIEGEVRNARKALNAPIQLGCTEDDD